MPCRKSFTQQPEIYLEKLQKQDVAQVVFETKTLITESKKYT